MVFIALMSRIAQNIFGFYDSMIMISMMIWCIFGFWAGCRHSLWNAHELIKLYNIMGMLIFYCVSWCIVNVICLFNKCHHDWHQKSGDDIRHIHHSILTGLQVISCVFMCILSPIRLKSARLELSDQVFTCVVRQSDLVYTCTCLKSD